MSQNFAFSAYTPTVSAKVAYTGTHSGATALPTGATRVAVKATTDAYILFGSSSVATVTSSNGWRLTAGVAEVFDILPGVTHFDVVQDSSGGNLYYASVSG